MKQLLLLFFLVLLSVQTQAQQVSQTNHIFLITLDGLRWQELYTGADEALIGNKKYVDHPEELKKLFWADDPLSRRKKLLPFLWDVIAKKGQLYGNREYGNKVNVTNNFWFSYPGYNEILTGLTDNRINSNNKVWNPNTTVLEFINNQSGFDGKVAAFGSWDVFPYIINEKRSGIPVNAGFEPAKRKPLSERESFLNELQPAIPSPWSSVRFDAFTHHYALEYIKKERPRVIYIAYGETDDFAHDGNYEAYLKSAHQTDAFIKELWDYVQAHPMYRGKTTFIITTDHGRGTKPLKSWRQHGTDIEGADEIWIAIMGPDTPALGELKEKGQYYQTQVARTATYLLGLNYNNEEQSVGQALRPVMK